MNLVGNVGDGGNGFGVTKIGIGKVVLAGDNTYGGLTEVKEGVLAVRHKHALGSAAVGTVVDNGFALELQSDIEGKPLTLNGDGVRASAATRDPFRNVSNSNTYSGPITLASNVTIGVDTGSRLTITGVIGDGGNNFDLTKEGTGRLVLTAANTYGGTTFVNAGTLDVRNDQALGGTAGGTVVLNGAQLQLEGSIIISEGLTLNGTGISQTGALLNLAGNNTWQGPITLNSDPVSVGVAVLGDVLTIDGTSAKASPMPTSSRSAPARRSSRPPTPTAARRSSTPAS